MHIEGYPPRLRLRRNEGETNGVLVMISALRIPEQLEP